MPNAESIEQSYQLARERYAEIGVDTDAALAAVAKIPISLHCWQGDDVNGFEGADGLTGGGIQATGNYPGRARNAAELRQDADKALSLIPGTHRFNLHGMYAETAGKVSRDELLPEHFSNWIDWAKSKGMGLDFNPSFFAHPLADDGFTLSHRDEGIRSFWVRHGIACRNISAAMGKALGTPCVNNVWIPDGMKDVPVDRKTPRDLLRKSLDEIFAEPISTDYNLDAVEPKLFGIGSESYVVGSHEFYMGYAVQNQKLLCLDAGHFHPTETIADKLTAVMEFVPEVLLHVSRGVRWDSDHVVLLTDDLRSIAEEIVRHNLLPRTHIGLDFFDASINRVAAWVIGTRCMVKALLLAFLQPYEMLQQMEAGACYTGRLGMLEELKTMPAGAVWDRYCEMSGVPVGGAWMDEVIAFEQSVHAKRS